MFPAPTKTTLKSSVPDICDTLSMGTNLEGSIDGLREASSEGRLDPAFIGPSRADGRRLAIVFDDGDGDGGW